MRLYYLTKNELQLEFRKKSDLSAIVFYNVASFYLISQLFNTAIHPFTWASLFILLQLFGSINAVAKSFIGDTKGKQLYYMQIASPIQLLASKTITSFLTLTLLSVISYLLSIFFFQNFISNYFQFALLLLLMNLFWAVLLTFLSAMAMKTNNGHTLLAVISLPLLIPFSNISIKLLKFCLDGIAFSVSSSYFLLLVLLIIIVAALSFLLFPYIWRD